MLHSLSGDRVGRKARRPYIPLQRKGGTIATASNAPFASANPVKPVGPAPLAEVAPPLLTNVFGRPVSLPSDDPRTTEARDVRQRPQYVTESLDVLTEDWTANTWLRPYNTRNRPHTNTPAPPSPRNGPGAHRAYVGAVPGFMPEEQPERNLHVDEEHETAFKRSVGNAVRPPTERALKMQSRDVSGWTEDIKGTNRLRDDDRNFPSGPPLIESAPTMTISKQDLGKPTCSLNLICYRPGSEGCVLRQVRVIDKQRFKNEADCEEALRQEKGFIESDQQFFEALKKEYEKHMRSFWRRNFSLKTLRHIRLLSYTPTTRPEIVPLDDFTLQEAFHAYNNPATVTTDASWIAWVFRLRQRDRRHALEFVESWSGTRIALIGSVPWVAATIVGIVWTLKGGEAQTAFTVAGFILTVGTSLLALLAIVSKIES